MSDPFWRIGAVGADERHRPRRRGRDALFSGSAAGFVRLRCQRCGVEASPRVADLVRGLPWVLAPRVSYPLRGRCPVCRRRVWLSVTAGERWSSGA